MSSIMILNEIGQKKGLRVCYNFTQMEGKFKCFCEFGSLKSDYTSFSKKFAKDNAAKKMLEMLDLNENT